MNFSDFFRRKNDESITSTGLYEGELDKIDYKIRELNKTIKFYEGKRRVLEEWRKVVMLNIKKNGQDDTCRNCGFFNNGYCMKYESSVNKDATCVDFVWGVD